MELNLNIEPEQINKAIAEAVTKSAIGVELNRVINEKVAQLSRSYDNPIKAVVDGLVNEAVRKAVSENYSEQIKKYVAEKMSESFMQEIIDKLWMTWYDSKMK